jgi:hypothetical protein
MTGSSWSVARSLPSVSQSLPSPAIYLEVEPGMFTTMRPALIFWATYLAFLVGMVIVYH